MRELFNMTISLYDNEISLFRKLAKLLAIDYKVTFIHETHKELVTFHSCILNTEVRKEISDLWIIMYSPKKRKARMTFLQVKKYPFNNRVTNPFVFKGDYLQHELLSLRPQIKNSQFPQDILSFTDNDSIGTFGVFYRDYLGQIDLAYATAKSIIPCGHPVYNKTSVYRTMIMPDVGINPYIEEYYDICNERSIISTLNLDIFVGGILNLIIGAEIHKDHQIMNFLNKTLRYFVDTNPEIKDFLNFIEAIDIRIEDNARGVDNIPNIALINVDRER